MRVWTNKKMSEEVLSLIPRRSVVNLGIGLPSLVADINQNKELVLHSENGVLGVSGRPQKGTASHNIINAAKETINISKGASFFDSALSFSMIRGGHVDVSVLGGMQVDVQGSIANWKIPGKKITGMGGAMDLVNGPKLVIVMMKHFNKTSEKLVPECSLPLTGKNCVDYIVTDCGVFKPCNNKFKIIKICDVEKFMNKVQQELYIE